MRRYYDNARAVLERHGGTVEKFVGDAVMAVFGIPVATEDDALRAVRAAVELRDAVHEPRSRGADRRQHGRGRRRRGRDPRHRRRRQRRGAFRAGGGSRRDPARRRPPSELVRDAVDDEPVELARQGASPQPVAAYRLQRRSTRAARRRAPPRPRRSSAASASSQRLDARLRGRRRGGATAALVHARSGRLGSASRGWSRDFLEHESATTRPSSRARALSYGEGITYWPLVEILLQLGTRRPTTGDPSRRPPTRELGSTRSACPRDAGAGGTAR